MTLKTYPVLREDTIEDAANVLREIIRTRQSDISEIESIKNRFISGRKVMRTPLSSSDIQATDRVGDISFSASYMYIVVDNSGTLVWRRVALASF